LARPTREQVLMPSLIDRLADPDLSGPGMLADFDVTRMMDSVRRDLEDLFNSHDPIGPVPAEYREVRSSILSYGLPDLPSLTSSTGFRKEAVGRVIEEVIARHEPRLRDVRVVMAEPGGDLVRHRIRFHIEARLNVDPSPEVEFETILELSTGQASIRPGRS
jgi:type VI secretion system protein ImpF